MVALVMSLLAGCSTPGEGEEGYRFTVTVEDGVEVALTRGGPRHEGEIFAYERVLELRPDPAVEESFLYSPQWMAMAEDGRIFVCDMGARQVVVFGGRPIIDDKGFLWLWLQHARDLPEGGTRWVLFSPEGEYLGKTTTPGWPQPQRGYLLTIVPDPESGEAYPVVFRIRPLAPGIEY